MLRSSRYLKLGQSYAMSRPLGTKQQQHRRDYNYQKEIYKSDFYTVQQVPKDVVEARTANPNVYRFINAYHKYGYKQARLDPLELNNGTSIDELDPKNYGLFGSSAGPYDVRNLLFEAGSTSLDLASIENYLKSTYSSNWAIEFEHVQNEEEKLWLAKEFEAINASKISDNVRLDLAKLLLKSQVGFV